MRGAWFRLEQGYRASAKFAEVSELAELLWVRLIDYSASGSTDGLIPKRQAPGLLNVQGWAFEGETVTIERLLDELLVAGLLEDRGSSWALHDYLEHQTSREEIEALRAARSEAGKRGARKRWHAEGQEPAPMASAMASAMANGWQADGKPDGKPMAEEEVEVEERSRAVPSEPPSPVPGSRPKAEKSSGKAKTGQEPARASRGTRIPSDLVLTPQMASYAREKAPSVDPEQEFEKFRNYWLGVPGQRGVKVDWIATWRNWVGTAHERKVERGWAPPVRSASEIRAEASKQEALAARRRWCEARGVTYEEWVANREDDEWRYALEARAEALGLEAYRG